MAADPKPLEERLVIERETWADGPPHALFSELRSGCPVHWSSEIPEFPDESGYWSVTTAEDIHAVTRDWQTYSSADGITTVSEGVMPLELIQAMFIGMDPPKHDRLKALFQRGFTPRRIAEHEDEIRAIAQGVLAGVEGRETMRPRHRRRPAGRLPRDRLVHGPAARGRRDLGAPDEHRRSARATPSSTPRAPRR